MYATKEEFRQYLASPARLCMSFQQYLVFTKKEGTMTEQIEQGVQVARDLELMMVGRERLANIAAAMLLLQLAMHLDRATEGPAA